MPESDALAKIPLKPANMAPPAPDYPWPDGFTSAMFLSFDVDAESAWTGKDPEHADRLVTMSSAVMRRGSAHRNCSNCSISLG
jgi:hypothetical protein